MTMREALTEARIRWGEWGYVWTEYDIDGDELMSKEYAKNG